MGGSRLAHPGRAVSPKCSPPHPSALKINRRIVSSSIDSTVRNWDAATGQPIGSPLTGHTDGVASVAFSPDGTRTVSGSADHTLRLWDVRGRGGHALHRSNTFVLDVSSRQPHSASTGLGVRSRVSWPGIWLTAYFVRVYWLTAAFRIFMTIRLVTREPCCTVLRSDIRVEWDHFGSRICPFRGHLLDRRRSR